MTAVAIVIATVVVMIVSDRARVRRRRHLRETAAIATIVVAAIDIILEANRALECHDQLTGPLRQLSRSQ